jgi:hypothetical protein
LAALSAQQIKQVRLRYEAFFGQTRGSLGGDWAWEDTKAAYLLLDSLALREETAGLARMLFEDFAHYFTNRKPRDQFAVLIVDEFSSLAQGAGMAGRIEQARGFNTSLILAPQVVAGMGDETEAACILGSVETVVCHRVNTPRRSSPWPARAEPSSIRRTTPAKAPPARAQHGCSTSSRSIRTRSGHCHPDTRTSSAAGGR